MEEYIMLVREALDIIKEEEGIVDQYELAKMIGVSQPTISNYYKGKSYPNLEVATTIYGRWGYRCEPFTELALEKEWELIKNRKGL
jgi:DNA-binding XRE family transcriptional regulator